MEPILLCTIEVKHFNVWFCSVSLTCTAKWREVCDEPRYGICPRPGCGPINYIYLSTKATTRAFGLDLCPSYNPTVPEKARKQRPIYMRPASQ